MRGVYPLAVYRPVPQVSYTVKIDPTVVVCHSNAGSSGDLYGWWIDPRSQGLYSHFQVDLAGTVYQYCPIFQRAPANVEANAWGVSIETANNYGHGTFPGFHTDQWTGKQRAAIIALIRWIVDEAHIRKVVCTDGRHGIGGHDWFSSWTTSGHVCLPVDTTEVLTSAGWLHLDEITSDHRVASMSLDSQLISFDKPLDRVQPYLADTVRIGGEGWEMTADHRVPVVMLSGRRAGRGDYTPKMRAAKDLGVNSRLYGFAAGQRCDTEGINIPDDLLALLVWVQADGHYATKNGRFEHLDFHFSKQRKVDRVTAILDRLGKKYSHGHRADGTQTVRVYGLKWLMENILSWLPDKTWNWWLLEANRHQFEIIDAELLFADGYVRGGIYCSTDKINRDVVSALYTINGYRVRPDGDSRLSVKPKVGSKQRHTYRRVDGVSDGRENVLVSCLTTVNDTLIIRQNGIPLVVGNCPGNSRSAQLKSDIIPSVVASDPSEDDEMNATEKAQLADTQAKAGKAWLYAAKSVELATEAKTISVDTQAKAGTALLYAKSAQEIAKENAAKLDAIMVNLKIDV